jgi:hypothetical protein
MTGGTRFAPYLHSSRRSTLVAEGITAFFESNGILVQRMSRQTGDGMKTLAGCHVPLLGVQLKEAIVHHHPLKNEEGK